jgi:hypothetical protein
MISVSLIPVNNKKECVYDSQNNKKFKSESVEKKLKLFEKKSKQFYGSN